MQVIDADIIQKTAEFEAVNQIFAELLEYERGYLAICLMNFSSGSTYANMWSKELELWECAARLIDRFELIACVYFENKDELLHAVYMHMKLSCYNYRNAVAHINPLRSEIQSKYAELFSMTKLCCERMAEDFPYPVNDDEVAYLATHFGVAMRSAVHEAELAYVLLACPSMTTSVQLLRAEIQTKFDNIIIEDVVRASEIDEYSARRQIDFVISTVACKCRYPVIKVNPILTDEDRANIITLMTSEIDEYSARRQIDFVISTVACKCRYPVIKVNPILTDEDRANIITLMTLLDIGTSLDSTQLKILLRIVRRNVDHTTYQRIREEINHYLNTEGSLVSVPESASARLYDALQMYGLRLVSEGSSDWESAVQETALPLLKKGCIEQRYAEKLIELGRAHGPYFVIGEDIAIAHARPQDGVKRLGLCLSIYPQGRYAEKLIELGRAHGPYFVIGEDIAIAHARPQDGVKRLGLCLSIYPQGLTIMSRSIRLLFVLASPNQQEHFRILQNIMSLNKNSSMLDALCSVQTEEQALALFASFQQNFDMLGVQL